MSIFLLALKNLRRNRLRTVLTSLAVVALVAVFSMIVTVLMFLDELVTEKNRDVRLLITERYGLLRPFDRRIADNITARGSQLNQALRKIRGYQPEHFNIWHFAIFTLDKELKDPDQIFFTVACYPEKIAQMTEDLQDFPQQYVDRLRGPGGNVPIVMGRVRMKRLKKEVGSVFTAWSTSHRAGVLRTPIQVPFEIVGEIPEDNRWSEVAFLDYETWDRLLEQHYNEKQGKITYLWLRFDDRESALKGGVLIENYYPTVKCETEATAYSRFLEPLRDILAGIKYFLVPAILIVMTVILANTFSITIRERQGEMALLKVLGFSVGQILAITLGEAALVGFLAGFGGSVVTFGIVNLWLDGIRLPEFPVLYMPWHIFWWGPLLGVLTAILGGLIPALNARTVRPAQIFARVT
ncbi:MAG: hypothetical protein KatS3mg105_3537 [Gemmatales bacterium]|nr:MAG: hypothetical protein KatS3mg105_3537 [Gemmatales bacterium]